MRDHDWNDTADHGGPRGRRRHGGPMGPVPDAGAEGLGAGHGGKDRGPMGRHGGPGGGGRHGGPGRGRGRGPHGGRPRGDVRAAILMLLAEQPRHGYDLIRAIEDRSDGAWTPSPGSIYPTLQALEDEGLVVMETVEGRKTASLTTEGEAWCDEHAAEHEALFDQGAAERSAGELRAELMALKDAAIHVARAPGPEDRTAQAVEILADARKRLYRLLADVD